MTGWTSEVVADGLDFPTSLAFDAEGTAYVAEEGLPFGGAPPGGRIWRLEPGGGRVPLAEGLPPPVNGLTHHRGDLVVSVGGHPSRILWLRADGSTETVVEGLPGTGELPDEHGRGRAGRQALLQPGRHDQHRHHRPRRL